MVIYLYLAGLLVTILFASETVDENEPFTILDWLIILTWFISIPIITISTLLFSWFKIWK